MKKAVTSAILLLVIGTISHMFVADAQAVTGVAQSGMGLEMTLQTEWVSAADFFSAGSDVGQPWAPVDGVFPGTNTGVRQTLDIAGFLQTKYACGADFALSGINAIPSDAVAVGFEVEVDRHSGPFATPWLNDEDVAIIVRDGSTESTQLGGNKLAIGAGSHTTWPVTTAAAASYGSASDVSVWAPVSSPVVDLTDADSYDATLSVCVRAITTFDGSGYGGGGVTIDAMRIRVTYTVISMPTYVFPEVGDGSSVTSVSVFGTNMANVQCCVVDGIEVNVTVADAAHVECDMPLSLEGAHTVHIGADASGGYCNGGTVASAANNDVGFAQGALGSVYQEPSASSLNSVHSPSTGTCAGDANRDCPQNLAALASIDGEYISQLIGSTPFSYKVSGFGFDCGLACSPTEWFISVTAGSATLNPAQTGDFDMNFSPVGYQLGTGTFSVASVRSIDGSDSTPHSLTDATVTFPAGGVSSVLGLPVGGGVTPAVRSDYNSASWSVNVGFENQAISPTILTYVYVDQIAVRLTYDHVYVAQSAVVPDFQVAMASDFAIAVTTTDLPPTSAVADYACQFGSEGWIVASRANDNQMTCIAPANLAAGTYPIAVSIDGGASSSTCDTCVSYIYEAGALSATSGSVTGGDDIDVTIVGGVNPSSTVNAQCRFTTSEGSFDVTGTYSAGEVSCTTPNAITQSLVPSTGGDVTASVTVTLDNFATSSVSSDSFTFAFPVISIDADKPSPIAGLPASAVSVDLEASNILDTSFLSCFTRPAAGGAWSTAIDASVSGSTVTCPLPAVGSDQTVEIGLSNNGVDVAVRAPQALYYYFAHSVTNIDVNVASAGVAGVVDVEISGAFLDTTEVFCSFGGNTVAATAITSSSLSCAAPSGSQDTAVTLGVSINGASGPFVNAATSFIYFTPSVTGIDRTIGPQTGTNVNILGDFAPTAGSLETSTAVCRYNGEAVSGTYGASTFVCNAPAMSSLTGVSAGDSVPVTVSLNGQEFFSAGNFVYHNDITIGSVTPDNADLDDTVPVTVTVTGTGFETGAQDAAFCHFGATTTAATVSSGTSLTCTAPSAASASTVQLTVSYNGVDTPSGESADFVFVDMSTALVSLADNFAQSGVAKDIVFTSASGAALTSAECRFDGGSLITPASVSGNTITCAAPTSIAGTDPLTSVSVDFTNNGVQFSNALSFTYFPAPSVTSLSVNNGAHDGTAITVNGRFLVPAGHPGTATVRFGSVGDATGTIAGDGNSISVTTPSSGLSTLTTVSVSVSLNGATFAGSEAYTFIDLDDQSITQGLQAGHFGTATPSVFSGTLLAGASAPGCRFDLDTAGTVVNGVISGYSATGFTCTTPIIGAVDTSDIELTLNGIDYFAVPASWNFNHYAHPTVSSVSLSSVATGVSGRSFVVGLTGTVLDAGAACSFGNPATPGNHVTASAVASGVDGTLTCTAPNFATEGNVDVFVSLNGLTFGPSSVVLAVVDPTIVGNVSPVDVQLSTSVTVTITTGANEVLADSDGILYCRFGSSGSIANNVVATRVGANTLTCPSPSQGSAASSVVSWSNNGLDWSNDASFDFDDRCLPYPCPSDTDCLQYTCNQPAGGCTSSAINEGGLCDSDSGTCVAGVCQADCTTDQECQDASGTVCDGDETCGAGGVCVAGTPLGCGICDDVLGCVDCVDDTTCTTKADECDNDYVCTNNVCVEGTVPVCSAPTPFCIGAGVCVECLDSTHCSGDDQCDSNGACVECLNNADCDVDGDVCNGDDTCNGAGACVPGIPLTCSDFCDATLGCVECLNAGHCDQTTPCDGDETCESGVCTDGADLTCPGQVCNDQAGGCSECAQNSDCDNGIYCDGVETCDIPNGLCVDGTPVTCSGDLVCNENTDSCADCAQDSNCVDNTFCDGTNTCNELTGLCENPNTNPCADPTPLCKEDTDSCVECLNSLSDCDDGEACNGVETCDGANTCQPGIPPCNVLQTCSGGSCSPVDAAVITDVLPSSGLPAGGYVLRLVATGIINEAGVSSFQCRFGGSNVQTGAILPGDTSIECPVPAGAEGDTTVEITFDGGDAWSAPATFTYNTPDCLGLSPSNGPAVGGTFVDIDTDFSCLATADALTVNIDGALITADVECNAATGIVSFVTPVGTPNTTVSVSWSNNGIDFSPACDFLFDPQDPQGPLALTFAPNTAGFSSRWYPSQVIVTVVGDDLIGQDIDLIRCRYGDHEVNAIEFVAPNSVTCPVPAVRWRWRPVETDFCVSLNAGIECEYLGAFTFASPRIWKRSPRRLPAGSDELITVEGYGFVDGPGLKCRFQCRGGRRSCPYNSDPSDLLPAVFESQYKVKCPVPTGDDWEALANFGNRRMKTRLRVTNNDGQEFTNKTNFTITSAATTVILASCAGAGGAAAAVFGMRARAGQRRRRVRSGNGSNDSETTDASEDTQSFEEQAGSAAVVPAEKAAAPPVPAPPTAAGEATPLKTESV